MCQSFIALLSFAAAVASAQTTFAAAPGWAGQYRNAKFLNGKAVFQLSIEQSGNAIQVSFDAVYNDAHGAAPEGQGPARVTGKDSLQFKWEDSFHNTGTGTIKRIGDAIILSMRTARVADPRCLMFYRENIRLQRVK